MDHDLIFCVVPSLTLKRNTKVLDTFVSTECTYSQGGCPYFRGVLISGCSYLRGIFFCLDDAIYNEPV